MYISIIYIIYDVYIGTYIYMYNDFGITKTKFLDIQISEAYTEPCQKMELFARK